MKKLGIAAGALVALIVLVFLIAGVVLYLVVDKRFIEAQIARALNRQVSIEKIDMNLFSVISGINVHGVAISNFKPPAELTELQGKPVDPSDLFAGIGMLSFKVQLLPLLKKQIELKELLLHRPVIYLSKNKQGTLNIDDLIRTPEKPEDAQKQEPAKPLSVDTLPVALVAGEVGLKDATVNYYDGKLDQSFQVYALTAFFYDIVVDPADLANKNDMKLKLDMGVKSVGPLKTGSVESFDITMNATGRVIPFDRQTRLLNPEAILHINLPDGQISGLQLFNAVTAMPIVGDYLGEYLVFLKGTQKWQNSPNSGVDLGYKAPEVRLQNGKLELTQALLGFEGLINHDTRAMDLTLEMTLAKDANAAIQAALEKKINATIKSPDIKKYARPNDLAHLALKPLLNANGAVYLKMKADGTTDKARITLLEPRLGSLGDLVQSQAGAAAFETGKKAVKELLDEDSKKVLEGVEELFKR